MNTDQTNSELFLPWCKFWCCVWFGTSGALGAYYCAKWYLNTPDSWLIREAEERRIDNKNQPFNFSIASLFARTTAVAVLIAFWTFVIRTVMGFGVFN